ncbi:MAG: hypothetical protein HEQ32_00015 [Vampirovibrio sp.]
MTIIKTNGFVERGELIFLGMAGVKFFGGIFLGMVGVKGFCATVFVSEVLKISFHDFKLLLEIA